MPHLENNISNPHVQFSSKKDGVYILFRLSHKHCVKVLYLYSLFDFKMEVNWTFKQLTDRVLLFTSYTNHKSFSNKFLNSFQTIYLENNDMKHHKSMHRPLKITLDHSSTLLKTALVSSLSHVAYLIAEYSTLKMLLLRAIT